MSKLFEDFLEEANINSIIEIEEAEAMRERNFMLDESYFFYTQEQEAKQKRESDIRKIEVSAGLRKFNQQKYMINKSFA